MTGTDTDRGRLLLVALVATTVLVLVAGTVVGAVSPGAAVGPRGTDQDGHADPADIESNTDLSAAERRLADRLAQRARSGSLNISRAEAAEAREQLNNSQYEALLDRYADVAEETGQVEKARAFRRVRRDQVALADALERYWNLYAWYQSLENGTLTSQQRMQAVLASDGYPLSSLTTARQLEGEWHRINRTHAELVAARANLSAVTRQNVSIPLTTVNESVAEVNETQQAVRDAEFTETRLLVTASDRRISYSKPVTLRGELTTQDYEPLANESVTFTVGDRTLSTRTSEAGRFAVTYRPATISRNISELTVTYEPGNESRYLGSSDDVLVVIEPVEPRLTVVTVPNRVAYNETVTITGGVGRARTNTDGVPYIVRVDGRVVDQNRTGPNGRYRTEFTVPAGLAAGERNVSVLLPLSGQALERTNASTTVTIEETPTNLTATASHVEGRTIRVSGTLETADGRPIVGQRIRIAAGSVSLGSVTTKSGGRYDGNLIVPSDIIESGTFDPITTVSVEVRYDGTETNLASDWSSRSVELPTMAVGIHLIAGSVLLLLTGAGVVWWRRNNHARFVGRSEKPDSTVQEPLDHRESGQGSTPVELFELARSHASAGRDREAIQLAYAALRRQLAREFGAMTDLTPWEVYQRCTNSSLGSNRCRAVREVTELYERAKFADQAIDAEDAQAVCDRLEDLLSDTTL